MALLVPGDLFFFWKSLPVLIYKSDSQEFGNILKAYFAFSMYPNLHSTYLVVGSFSGGVISTIKDKFS